MRQLPCGCAQGALRSAAAQQCLPVTTQLSIHVEVLGLVNKLRCRLAGYRSSAMREQQQFVCCVLLAVSLLRTAYGIATDGVQHLHSIQLDNGSIESGPQVNTQSAPGTPAVRTGVGQPLDNGEATSSASKCYTGCTIHGTCNEELGRCDCPKPWMGPDCGTPTPLDILKSRCQQSGFSSVEDCKQTRGHGCLNKCNNRGKCMGGYCHCQPGTYGADCSLSLDASGKPQLLANTTYKTRQKRPWVYVYELPPHLTTWLNNRRLDRPTAHMFWQRLLSSGARTADPEQADWFFIPIRQRGQNPDRVMLVQTIEYIRSTWPYWDRLQGHRHFMFATADVGVAEVDQQGRAMAENVTWLSHWGLTKQHAVNKNWEPAHRPGKDIVVPIMLTSGHYAHVGMTHSPLHPRYQTVATMPEGRWSNLPAARDKVFFFAGRVCGHRGLPDNSRPPPANCEEGDGYSGGVRQAVWYHFLNRTGWTISMHENNYDQALSSHTYCLAPLGGGHGQRQVLAASMGCIPVTIGDDVMQPFEPELPWPTFSVPVLEKDVPSLPRIFDQISLEQVAAMQARLRCAAQHLIWTSIQGGFIQDTGRYDAFETVLEVLRMQQLYPDATPDQYINLDDDFRRFVACGAEQLGEEPPPLPAEFQPPPLCSHSLLDGKPQSSCHACKRGQTGTHGMPGGIICCSAPRGDIAACPRVWG